MRCAEWPEMAFSSTCRGFRLSCGARRMAQTAAPGRPPHRAGSSTTRPRGAACSTFDAKSALPADSARANATVGFCVTSNSRSGSIPQVRAEWKQSAARCSEPRARPRAAVPLAADLHAACGLQAQWLLGASQREFAPQSATDSNRCPAGLRPG